MKQKLISLIIILWNIESKYILDQLELYVKK